MGIKRTIAVIAGMEADGIIGRYAISGAFAAFYYVEASVTEALDVLVSFDRPSGQEGSGLIILAPIFSYLENKGYSEHRSGGILIEGWPVQFLPVASELDAEALDDASDIEFELGKGQRTVTTRILRPEHIVATALRIGRPKDLLRIVQFWKSRRSMWVTSPRFSLVMTCRKPGKRSASALEFATTRIYLKEHEFRP